MKINVNKKKIVTQVELDVSLKNASEVMVFKNVLSAAHVHFCAARINPDSVQIAMSMINDLESSLDGEKS